MAIPWPPTGDGILPSQQIRRAIDAGAIALEAGLGERQVQPNSLDLRLSARAHRVQCSFLPIGGIERHFEQLEWYAKEVPPEGHVLEPGQVWVFELMESLELPPGVSGRANPKSSTGRLDVFARLITRDGDGYDTVPAGYRGPLYLEVAPRSFAIKVRPGDSLAQLRLQVGDPVLSNERVAALLTAEALVISDDTPGRAPMVDGGIHLSVRIQGDGRERKKTIGFRARLNAPPIDLRARDLPVHVHWDRIYGNPAVPLVLEPGAFYIFASRERVRLPPQVCAEMVPFDASRGEVRTHYAGFFDSGFGYEPGVDPRLSAGVVVLEVRNRDVPFLLEHGQTLFRFELLANLAPPAVLYGAGARSHYQSQGLRLGKQFLPEEGTDEPAREQIPLPLAPRG